VPKKFQFRLQPLIDQKEMLIRRARQELNEKKELADKAAQAMVELGKVIAQVNERLASAEAYLRERQGEALARPGDWGPTLAVAEEVVAECRDHVAQGALRQRKAELNIASAAKAVATAHAQYMQLWREQTQLEALRDLDRAIFRREQEMKEMAEISEVGAAIHYLNQFVEKSGGSDGHG
jgi:hypothetical protein